MALTDFCKSVSAMYLFIALFFKDQPYIKTCYPNKNTISVFSETSKKFL